MPPSSADSPVAQRSTQFAAAEGDSAPPPELKTFGAVFAVLWVAVLAWLLITRRRQVALLARTAQVQRGVTALPEP